MIPPGTEGFVLTAENRPAVRAWLKAEGIDPDRVDGMRDDTLYKAYRQPAYLRQMKTRADYYPQCRKENTPPCSIQQPMSEAMSTPIAIEGGRNAPIPIASMPANGSEAGSTPEPTVDTADLLEQWIIELIRQHVPAIIMEILSK